LVDHVRRRAAIVTTAEPAGSEAVRMVRAAEARQSPWGREVGSRAEQVALLIDFENLVLGASASLPDRAEPVPANALTWLCRAYGSTTIRRAYADWADQRFGRYQQAFERNGFDLVQIGHGPSRKERRRHPHDRRRDGDADHPSVC
jgi:hypothetical protein